MKSIQVKGGNFKSLRAGIPKNLLPTSLKGLSNLLIADKFNGQYIINSVQPNDAYLPDNEAGRSYDYPTRNPSGTFGDKEALLYERETSTNGSYLRVPLYLSGAFTITVAFAITGSETSSQCPISGHSDNGVDYFKLGFVPSWDQEYIIDSNILGESTEMFSPETILFAPEVITITQDIGGTKIYRKGDIEVFSSEEMVIPSLEYINIGGRSPVESSFTPLRGFVPYLSTYDRKLNSDEVLDVYNQLSNYYSI